MKLVKTDVPGFMKDPITNVIINNDETGYKDYKTKKEQAKELRQIKNDIETLKAEMDGLKQAISRLLESQEG